MNRFGFFSQNYPYGVPKRFLVSEDLPKQQICHDVRILFLVSSADHLAGGSRSFLDAVVAKGLKVPLSSVLCIDTLTLADSSGLSRDSFKFIVEFGVSTNSSLSKDKEGRLCLTTTDPLTLANSQEKKKEFWLHLKEIIKEYSP